MRVLVTGADGFLGSAIGEQLAAAGHEVVGTVFLREPRGPAERRVDVTRPADLEALPPGPYDALVHNAGVVDPRVPPARMHAVNAGGTAHVVAWARRHTVRHWIQVSSIGVYGLGAMGEDRTERTGRMRLPLGVPYQRSKARAERHVEGARIPFTLLRFPAILGAGDTVVTPALAGRLMRGDLFRCGRQERRVSLLDASCIGRILGAVLSGGPAGEALNAASHHASWSELVAAYAAALGVDGRCPRRSILTVLAHLRDYEHLFIATTSRFGAHFPTERFEQRYGALEMPPWQDAVARACAAYRATRPRAPHPTPDPPPR